MTCRGPAGGCSLYHVDVLVLTSVKLRRVTPVIVILTECLQTTACRCVDGRQISLVGTHDSKFDGDFLVVHCNVLVGARSIQHSGNDQVIHAVRHVRGNIQVDVFGVPPDQVGIRAHGRAIACSVR